MGDIISLLKSIPGGVAQGLIYGVLAIGLFITFKILNVADLTIDGSITTGAYVCAVLVIKGVPIPIAMLIAFIAGFLAGLVTGFLHTLLGIPAILAGILTQMVLWTVNMIIGGGTSGNSIVIPNTVVKKLLFTGEDFMFKTWNWGAFAILLSIVLLVSGALYWFFGTEFGISLRATGNNHNMSRAQGINTAFATVFGLALSNGIVALAGSLLIQYRSSFTVTGGAGSLVTGLAAIVVGEVIFSKISSNFFLRLLGVVAGSIIYWIIYQIAVRLVVEPFYLKMLAALIVIIFLGVPYLKKTYFSKKKKKKEQKEGEVSQDA